MSSNKLLVFTIVSGISGVLSIMGSTAIIYNVLYRNSITRLKTTYHRLMFFMSVVDIILSLSASLSTLPAPSDSPGVAAFGNTATCTTQGFFITFSSSSVILYNFFLTVHYLLTICYNFTEHRMQKKVEPFFHLISLGYPLCASIYGLYLKVYNFAGVRCWIATFPTGCMNNDNVQCTRGISADSFRWIASGYIVSFVLIAMPILMAFIIWTVWTRERKMNNRNNHTSTNEGNRGMMACCWCCTRPSIQRPRDEYLTNRQVLNRTKAVAKQCLLYMLAFILTWIWSYSLRVIEISSRRSPFWLQVLAAIFAPLQGFFNYLVFMKRQVTRLRKQYPEYSLLQAFAETTFHPARCDLITKRYFVTRLSTIHQNKRQASMIAEVNTGRKTNDANGVFELGCQNEKNKCEKKDDSDIPLDEAPGGSAPETQSATLQYDVKSQSDCIKYESHQCDDCQFDIANMEEDYCADNNDKSEVAENIALKIEDFDVTSGGIENVSYNNNEM